MKKQFLIFVLLMLTVSSFSQPFRRDYITAKYLLSGSYLQFPNTGIGTISRPEADSGENAKNISIMGGWTTETGYNGGGLYLYGGNGSNKNGDVFISGGWTWIDGNFGQIHLGTDIAGSYDQDAFAKTQDIDDSSNKLATTEFVVLAIGESFKAGEIGDNINFDNTTSDSEIGIIYKAGSLWLHNYEDEGSWGDNTFLGENAGNLTMYMHPDTAHHASANSGFGKDVLMSIETAWACSAFGRHSQKNNKFGTENSSFGRGTFINLISGNINSTFGKDGMYHLIDGDYNCGFGHNNFFYNQHGNFNVGMGEDVGYLTTGDGNIYFGFRTGNQNTTGSYQIVIGYDLDAVNVSNDYELNIGGMITGNTNPGLLNFNGKTNNFRGDLIISENTPSLQWTDEDGPTDGKTYRWIIANGDMYFETLKDDGTKADEIYRIMKTGGVVDEIIYGDYITTFSGETHGITPTAGDNSTKFATTAYVDASGGGASGADVLMNDNTPSLTWTDSDGPTDGKTYRWIVANGDMYFETLLDDGSKGDDVFFINRTNGEIDDFTFGSYPVKFTYGIELGTNIIFKSGASGIIAREEADTDANAQNLVFKGGWTTQSGYDGGSVYIYGGNGANKNGDVFISGGWTWIDGDFGEVHLGSDIAGAYDQNVFAKTPTTGDSSNKVATTEFVDIAISTIGSGSVESVGLSAPSGFAVTGSPVTGSGTLALSFDTGYSLPTIAYQSNWNLAFGWGDHAGLYSVLAHDHAGLYEDDLGNPSVDGYVLSSTIAGVRSWIAPGSGGMVYPDEGIPVSTESGWGTSIDDNSSNWNTAYDDMATSVVFSPSGGALTINQQDGGSIATNIDGRYVKISDVQSLTFASTLTMDYDNGTDATITLTSNITLTLGDVPDGGTGSIAFTQDGTGSRTLTLNGSTGYTSVKWRSGEKTLSTGASKIDIVSYKRMGSILFCTLGNDWN